MCRNTTQWTVNNNQSSMYLYVTESILSLFAILIFEFGNVLTVWYFFAFNFINQSILLKLTKGEK